MEYCLENKTCEADSDAIWQNLEDEYNLSKIQFYGR